MSDPLSPLEQELVNAMDEYAHHAAPPGFNPTRIISRERRRLKVRISLATVSLATAAGIAACVATGAPGSGNAMLPVTGESTAPATASAMPSTSPSPGGGSASATGSGNGGGSGTVNGGGGGTGGAVGSSGNGGSGGSTAPSAGVAPSWPTAATSSPFAGSVPPVPVLISIRAGTHPEGGYDRISLEFSGQVPGFQVGYVQQVVRDGSGASVSLPGSAFLQLTFKSAQAHDANGNSTLTPGATSPVSVGYSELRSYVLNGDFEGTVSVALGLTAPHGFHVSELTKSATDHVIYVDVARK